MSNTKHTPGPWTIKAWYYRRPGSGESWFIFDSKDQVMHSPGGDAGTMRSPEPYTGYGFTEADARLIAAAPELLEALELVMHRLVDRHELDEAAVKARAAIAKATGE